MSSKITVIGAGSVGSTIAYTLSNGDIASEIVLIDINKEKVAGEVMDIAQGTCFRDPINIVAGEYEDAKDSDIVIITSGIARKPGQTRIELTQTNVNILKSITPEIVKAAPNALYIIVSNPVDIMTYVFTKISGLPENQIIGSGTILDTARLRYMMSEYLDVSSSNMHAYIMGEHGDSSFVPWTHAYVGSKSLLELLDEKGKPLSDLHDIYTNVQQAAYEIINRKKATFYGIGLSLNRLVHAVLDDENAILTVSAYQEGEYQQKGLYIGVPAVVNREGVREVIRLKLNEVDQAKFDSSCRTLKEINRDIIDPLL